MRNSLIVFLFIIASLYSFPYQSGWPREIEGGVDFSSPVLVDVDGDDTLEVLIAGNDKWVYLFNHRGEDLPGWPQSTSNPPGPHETSSPAVGDIDNDGALEIVYASDVGDLFAWEIDGNAVFGFPVSLGDQVIRACVTLEEIDGDPMLEICIGTGATQYKFFVYNHDGSLVFSKDVEYRVHSTAAVGDIDKDGNMEIVHGVDRNVQYGVYAWEANGSSCTGWPQETGHHVDGSPALADVDNDSLFEVFVGAIDNMVYGWDFQGQDLISWPNGVGSGIYEGVVSSPAIGDIDNDNELEIVIGRGIIQSTYGAVFAFNASGDTVAGFPVTIATGSITSSPALADLDGDAEIEIVVGCQDGYLYGLNPDGSTVTGFPVPVATSVTSSPAVGDIDLDGDIELIVGGYSGGNDSLYVWDLTIPYIENRAPWPMFHHDPKHTGVYPIDTQVVAQEKTVRLENNRSIPTIIRGPVNLARVKSYQVYDIAGRPISSSDPGPGVYFMKVPEQPIHKIVIIE